MVRRLALPALCSVALALLAAGCQNTVNTLSSGPEVSQLDLQSFSSDSFCRERLAVMSVHRSRSEGGVMKLQVALRSERYGFFPEIWSWLTDENPYYVNYRVDWFEPDGMRVDSPSSNWMTVIFYPGETKYLQSVAPNSKCSAFMMSLKEKNDD